MKKYCVLGIVYDTDGEEVNLPACIEVECESEDDVIDAISDTTGWLVESVADIIEL